MAYFNLLVYISGSVSDLEHKYERMNVCVSVNRIIIVNLLFVYCYSVDCR